MYEYPCMKDKIGWTTHPVLNWYLPGHQLSTVRYHFTVILNKACKNNNMVNFNVRENCSLYTPMPFFTVHFQNFDKKGMYS